MSTTILEQVRGIASDVFGESLAAITAQTTPKSLESWDSLQHLNLVLALEEGFRVEISPDDAERMDSIAAIAEVIGQKLG
jgi:acyl carrier protein